jgi:DNA invertase Pin-like site-specific DNA recombinase
MIAAPSPADTEIVWGAYARLSRKKPNRRRGGRQLGRHRDPDESVERQMTLIRTYAEQHGLVLDEHLVFTENGRSAWWKPGGPRPVRPVWDAMIAAGRAGRFGGLLTWKLDRFARDHYDGQDLIHLGVLLDGPETGRIDPRTNDGQTRLNTKVEAARAYSHEISEKVGAAFAAMLADGYRVGGSGRLFGFEILSQCEFGEDDETASAAVVREDEAEIIRELARRLLAGETVQSMADDLNARGVTTTRGGRWEPRNLSRTLGNPLYGGELAYKGKPVTGPGGEPVRLANVEAILDTETYQAVRSKLTGRKKGPRPAGRYPLSGVLVCGNPACERKGTMAGSQRTRGGLAYVCARPGKVPGCGQSVSAAPVEAMVRDRVLKLLADVERRERIRAADTALDEQRGKLHAELSDLIADMAEAEERRAAIPRSQAARREVIDRDLRAKETRCAAIERQLAELGPAAAPAPPLDPVTAEEWDRDTLPKAKAAYVRELRLRVTIGPPARPQGSSRGPFDTGRVRITQD